MKADPGLRWEQLEQQSLQEKKQPVKHNQSKNWDKLANEAAAQEDKDVETGGGDAALQQMFKVSCLFLPIWPFFIFYTDFMLFFYTEFIRISA